MNQQYAFSFAQPPSHAAEDFFVTEANEIAYNWLMRGEAWPTPLTVLYGPPGCGKTHLARCWQAQNGARWLENPAAEDAMPWFQSPASLNWIVRLPFPCASACETNLFHLYNDLQLRRGKLLLIARTPPSSWSFRLADWKSRALAAAALTIDPPDDILLRALLQKQALDRQLLLPPPVIEYLAARMPRQYDAIRDVISRLDRLSMDLRRNITIPLARAAL